MFGDNADDDWHGESRSPHRWFSTRLTLKGRTQHVHLMRDNAFPWTRNFARRSHNLRGLSLRNCASGDSDYRPGDNAGKCPDDENASQAFIVGRERQTRRGTPPPRAGNRSQGAGGGPGTRRGSKSAGNGAGDQRAGTQAAGATPGARRAGGGREGDDNHDFSVQFGRISSRLR
jgi:hypothetical protein